MSAVEEANAAAVEGALPQLPYGDAVHTVLAALAFLPDTIEAGVRRESIDQRGELFLRLEWLPGNDDLVPATVQADGLVVQWSHLTGWSTRCGDDLVAPGLADLADPALVADAAVHAALHGLRCRCEPVTPGRRWSEAHVLDAALQAYDERPVTW
ncbi:hypothetical protein ACFWBR_42455 [Streptomyces sp. NPDC060006]|uniref:hypothetical protein n=1 Tax=unclassified Streptomyces TaxID=2593676 RepID=UPI0036AE9DAF